MGDGKGRRGAPKGEGRRGVGKGSEEEKGEKGRREEGERSNYILLRTVITSLTSPTVELPRCTLLASKRGCAPTTEGRDHNWLPGAQNRRAKP